MSRPRIVVLRALSLGDLLVVVPALRAIRRHWRRHHILLATDARLAPVVALTEAVDELIPTRGLSPLPAAAGHPAPAVVINLHGPGPDSSAVLDELRPLRRMGHAADGWPGPPWRPGLDDRERWCDLLAAHGVPADPGDVRLRRSIVPSPAPGSVVLHVGAGDPARLWPVERFAAVGAALSTRGHRVVVSGSESEQARAAQIAWRAGLPPHAVLAGSTGLAELTALVADARLLVSADTGVAHLSYAYRVPSVVLFAKGRNAPPPDGPHVALGIDAAPRAVLAAVAALLGN